MRALKDSLAVGVGGALGALVRYLCEQAAPHLPGAALAVLLVNLVGAYLIGLLMELFLERTHTSPSMRLAATTGLLGGLTTFGTLMGQVGSLLHHGAFAPAALLGALEPLIGIAATLLGQGTVRSRAAWR